ncbi:MAG: threonine synthase [bacterium]
MDRLLCASCGKAYSLDDPRWGCECGGLLDIEFSARFDLSDIASREPTMWRYREAIPIRDAAGAITLGEGLTPLREYKAAGRKVLVKEEYLNPTGSFKDRGASVVASRMKEIGVNAAVEDSSGNAGAAVAAYCREAGVRCTVYVPEGVRPEKAERIRHYGAELREVHGTREDCAAEALKAAAGAYYASHSRNPFFLQGTKTFAYEVCEQLDYKAPDAVVLPVGNGTLLLGTYLGFKDLLAAGVVGRMPKLIGVQARACAPLFRAFHEDSEPGRIEPPRGPCGTMADGIAIASPARGNQVLAAVRETGGDFFAVDDLEIMAALRDVSAKGFQIEPTAAAGVAGLARYLARGEPADTVITAFTGNNAPAARY